MMHPNKKYEEVMHDSYISIDKLIEKANVLNNVLFISNSNFNDIETVSTKINLQKIYEYYKDEDGINPHALMPNYLKKTEAEEKFGGYND